MLDEINTSEKLIKNTQLSRYEIIIENNYNYVCYKYYNCSGSIHVRFENNNNFLY